MSNHGDNESDVSGLGPDSGSEHSDDYNEEEDLLSEPGSLIFKNNIVAHAINSIPSTSNLANLNEFRDNMI